MTKTEIANMAVSHTGSGKEIGDLDTERSQEASACRRFYDIARKQTLKDYWWPFTSTTVALALVEATPTAEWAFSYRYPANCLEIRRIPSGIRNDSEQSRTKFKIGRDLTGFLIYTDKEDAEVEFTFDEEDTDRYPADFIMALSLRLAVYIAPRLTAGDPFKMGDRARALYTQEISKAAANAENEENPDQRPDSEFIRAREE